MLQIASGMYFRSGVPLHETLHRATVYTNALRLDRAPVDLPIAGLRFSTALAPFAPVTVEVMDRLEAERPDGQPEFMVATSGQDLVDDVATVLAFATNTTWSSDHDLVRRLVPDALSQRPRGGPSSQLRRTFDPQVLLTDDDIADAAAFSTELLALRRQEYGRAIRAIRRVVDATLLIADDVSLAYTLFVAALESLAAATTAVPMTWDSLDANKRQLLDPAFSDLTDEQAQRVRDAVLTADALGLGRKFRTFVLAHMDPSFFRGEALDVQQPMTAHDLPHALDFAYRVRSRQVHALQRLAPEMWVVTERADTVHAEGRTVLSLEGLNRLCRHVIRQYIRRAPTDLDTGFDYREELPGIVRMRVAPQYWIWQAEGLRVELVPAVLDGFLELLLPTLRGDEGAALVDMTPVLERIETLLPGEASPVKRAPLVALYRLWQEYAPPEHCRPDAQRVLARFGADLDSPSAAAFSVAVLTTGDIPWATEDLLAFTATRRAELLRGKGQPLPPRFDAALELYLARRLSQNGRREEALGALGRAVEILPGNRRLVDLEAQAMAGADPAALSSLDVADLLVRVCDVSAPPGDVPDG